MDVLLYLIPIALLLGAAGLAAFFWALRNGQFEDPEGAAHRVLQDDASQPTSGVQEAGKAAKP